MPQPIALTLYGQQIPGSRENQEDSYGWTSNDQDVLCIVSDGMGGMARGEEYSRSAVAQAMEAFALSNPDTAPHRVLLDCYARIRQGALALRQSPEDSDGGATVVMALVREGQCSFLSIGDSRICLVRGGGLIQLNREQTLGPMLDERAALGVISESVAAGNCFRSSLINHSNMDTPLPCDMNASPFLLLPGDQLVLMSDGVFGTLSDEELTRCLSHRGEAAVTDVMRAIGAKGKTNQDNSTLVLLEAQ